MSRLCIPFFCLIGWVLSASVGFAGTNKIKAVDINQVFMGYYRTKEGLKDSKLEEQQIKKELNERLLVIHKIEEDAERLSKKTGNSSLSDAERKKYEAQYQEKIQEGTELYRDYIGFQQRRNRQLLETVNARREGLFEEVKKIINNHAETEGYDYCLHKTERGMSIGATIKTAPFVLYIKDEDDISDLILKELNKNAPKKTP